MKAPCAILALCLSASLFAQQQASPATSDTSQTQPQAQSTETPKSSPRKTVTSFWPAVSAAKSDAPLTPLGKLRLAGFNTLNPFPIASAAAQAGISQAIDSNSGYGQGGEGYAKRFGAYMGNTASSQFFGTFVFPTILHQDPRYFRKAEGPAKSRIGYAISRVFVTRTDAGRSAPNVSYWLGAGSAAALSNLYYPPGDRSFGDAATRFGISFASTAGFNIFKEFWPDIKRKVFKK